MIAIQGELLTDRPGEIVLPKVEYKQYADIKQWTAYTGRVVPIPFVLIEYLSYMELKVFAFIIDQIRSHTGCYTSQKEIAKRLGFTEVAISHSVSNLVKMGFVSILPHTRKRGKTVNFDAIECLVKLTEDRKPGAAHFLREKIGLRNVTNLTPVQLSLLDNFGGCEDEVENEEYD